MAGHTRGSRTVHDIKYHIVWITKSRYKILTGKVAERVRALLIEGCESRGITIVEVSVGKEYVRMLISCPIHIAPVEIVQYLKDGSSRLIQEEFPKLKKMYWRQNLWDEECFCATIGSVTQEMIQEYIEHQFKHGDNGHFRTEDK
jgi:putative transposase